MAAVPSIAFVLFRIVCATDPNSFGLLLLQKHAELETRIEIGSQAKFPAHDSDSWTPQQHVFMQYIPSRNMVVCSCAKCGSTSLYRFIFETEFGHEYEADGCGIHEVVDCPQWKNEWRVIHNYSRQYNYMEEARSYALIRDPKERLVSAWKSKLACDSDRFYTNKEDTPGRVRNLQTLADWKVDESACMTLEEFVQALHDIKRLNRQKDLDRHFLPQHLGCFRDFAPSRWSKVFTAGNQDGFQDLAARLGSSVSKMRYEHSSSATVHVSENASKLLDELTRPEYEMLEPYLERESRVVAGAEVLVIGLGTIN